MNDTRTYQSDTPGQASSAMMTIEDVASLLRYSVKTIYKKAARGEIPSFSISSRKRLFSRDVISYWLANKQVGKL